MTPAMTTLAVSLATVACLLTVFSALTLIGRRRWALGLLFLSAGLLAVPFALLVSAAWRLATGWAPAWVSDLTGVTALAATATAGILSMNRTTR